MSGGRRVLITGAGRGLGWEWVRQEIEDGATVFATTREEAAAEVRALQRPGSDALTVLPMDVTDDASVSRCAREVQERAGALDLLVHNAGVFGPRDEQPLAGTPDEVRRVLEVNAVGPYRVTRAFLPLLRLGTAPRVVFVTSRMGSIGDAPAGGYYAYRMSKSALNMLGANLARDLRGDGVVCLIVHPGWVRTRMGGPTAPLEAAESVRGLRRIAARASIGDSGTFVDHSGARVPW